MNEHETTENSDLNDDIPFGADPTPEVPETEDPTMPEDPPVEEPAEETPAAASAEAVAEVAAADAPAETVNAPERLNVRVMALSVPLTESERLGLLDTITHKLAARDKLAAEKKEKARDYSDRIKRLDVEIKEASESAETGHGTRDVEVYEERDVFKGIVRVIRSDTGAVVQERPMTDSDRQLTLGDHVIDGGKSADVISLQDHAPEQLAASPEEAEELREARIAQERHERAIAIANTARIWRGKTKTHAYVDMKGGQLDGIGDDDDEATADLRKKVEDALADGDDVAPPKEEAPPVPAPKGRLKAPKNSKAKRKTLTVEMSDGTVAPPVTADDPLPAWAEGDSDEDAAKERKARTADEVDLTPADGGAF